MLTREEFIERVNGYWGQLYDDEKHELYQLATMVPEGGRIVEIGALYGLSTACLALGAPGARILSIDNWSYRPLASMLASPEENAHRLEVLGIHNVEFLTADSMTIETPNYPIDLLWIDAGHDYEHVHHDIFTSGPAAKVIACHDYGFSYEGVTQAIDEFVASHPEYEIDHQTVLMVVIKKKS